MTDKNIVFEKILWLDMEMTGLDPVRDRIVEVAAIITDWDFNELAVFESGVHHNKRLLEKRIGDSPFWAARPKEAQEMMNLALASPKEKDVQQELVDIVNAHMVASQPVLLAGNSIHQDRKFISRWWPLLEERLHYRMLDVSSWKVVMQGKYDLSFQKSDTHRALDDIRESIAEFKMYLNEVKVAQKIQR
jgi:oligoribonuclease